MGTARGSCPGSKIHACSAGCSRKLFLVMGPSSSSVGMCSTSGVSSGSLGAAAASSAAGGSSPTLFAPEQAIARRIGDIRWKFEMAPMYPPRQTHAERRLEGQEHELLSSLHGCRLPPGHRERLRLSLTRRVHRGHPKSAAKDPYPLHTKKLKN